MYYKHWGQHFKLVDSYLPSGKVVRNFLDTSNLGLGKF